MRRARCPPADVSRISAAVNDGAGSPHPGGAPPHRGAPFRGSLLRVASLRSAEGGRSCAARRWRAADIGRSIARAVQDTRVSDAAPGRRVRASPFPRRPSPPGGPLLAGLL
eukprot:9481868-Pyramimonas_sp.AAC.1